MEKSFNQSVLPLQINTGFKQEVFEIYTSISICLSPRLHITYLYVSIRRYPIASVRCKVSIASQSAKSAIVRATFKIRW